MNQSYFILFILCVLCIFANHAGAQDNYEIYHASDIKDLLEQTKSFDLYRVMIVDDVDISEIRNINTIILTDSIILNNFDLHGVNIYLTADFTNTTFSSAANIEGTNFAGPVSFENATFRDKLYAKNAKFKDRDSSSNFREAKFYDAAVFTGVEFEGGPDFENAEFNGQLHLENAKFKDKDSSINFKGTKFYDAAVFTGVEFEGRPDFENAVFKIRADFTEAKFYRGCEFRASEFNDNSFSKTRFADIADYENATFHNTANFTSAVFLMKAKFNYASFMNDANFVGSSFGDTAGFKSFFNGFVDLRHSDINADFSTATFHNETNVNIAGSRLIYININYDYIKKPLPCERPLLMKLKECYGGQREIQDKISIRAADCTICPTGDYGCQLYKYIESIDTSTGMVEIIIVILFFNLIIFPLFYWKVGCLKELEKERINKVDYIYLSIASILSQKHDSFKTRCCRWASLLQFVLFAILLFLIALIIAKNLQG